MNAPTMSISWNEAWADARTGGRHVRNERRFGRVRGGRPPGAVGVRTLWAMYIVLFVGSGLQWLCS